MAATIRPGDSYAVHARGVADQLLAAGALAWDTPGLTRLHELLDAVQTAAGRRDAEAMFDASVSLAAVAEALLERTRYAGRADVPAPGNPDFPVERVNDLVHRLGGAARPHPQPDLAPDPEPAPPPPR